METNKKKVTDLIALNRRNFIKLLVGGAVGINLTPLPWKLTDDIAIWTQNWSWVPVPPVGEFTRANSVCTLCPGGCGIEVRKVGNRAVKIEGRTDYPVNPGGICPLGAGGLQLLYNEDNRFTGPMKRVGPRGAGEFAKITWDEALKELTDRISGLRAQGRPEAIAAVDGNPSRSSMAQLIQRFLRAVGSPNYTTIPRAEDIYALANRLMMGNAGPMAYDLENADFILSFGCGLIEGWGSPGRVMDAWRLWHSGDDKSKSTRIVQVDSRASNTASKADQWLAARPGTDGALALGLAHVILQKGLYNSEFIDHFTFGFEDWTSSDGKAHKGFKTFMLEEYTPQAVSKITGIDAQTIVSVAENFAKAKAPVALFGKGKGNLGGSLFECMAIQALNALLGRINRPGGVLIHDALPLNTWPETEEDEVARTGLRRPRLDHAGTAAYPFSESLIHNMAEEIIASSGTAVDTLMVFSANPVHSLPDNGLFKTALAKIPFIVSFSPYKDDTAFMADLILPAHTYLEKTQDIAWPAGLQYPLYGMSKPVVDPLYDTRDSGNVLIEMAKSIGDSVESAFPWDDFEGALKARVKGLFEAEPGLTRYDGSSPVWKDLAGQRGVRADYGSFDDLWEKLKNGGMWYRPTHHFGNWGSLFKTPTGRFEFFSAAIETAVREAAQGDASKKALQDMGVKALGDGALMPHYEANEVPSEIRKSYPLVMVPYELINLSSDWLPNPHFLNKTLFDHQLRKNESFADINPLTADEYHLAQGDRMIIESAKGTLAVRVNIFEGAMPGVVFLPLGLGHAAYDEYQRGKGANPNEIIDAGKDPLSGQTAWWKTRVKIAKV